MVRAAKEDDLYSLAAQAGKEDDPKEEGVSLKPVFLGPQSGRIDEGFETRVKAPDRTAQKTSARKTETAAEKKGPGRPRGSTTERAAADIAETLEEKFALIFGLLTSALPVTGTYGVENSGKAVKSLLDIGKRRPAVMRALMKIADGADGLEIGKFALGLAVALQVDMGRMLGDALPARATGVTEVIEKYFMEDSGENDNPSVVNQVTHARFQPV